MAKIIPLTQGYETIVDDEDYEMLQRLATQGKAPKSWQVRIHKTHRGKLRTTIKYYAQGAIKTKDGKQKRVTLHALLLRPPAGFQVDHKDGNGLNNQRENLRTCTPTQNQQNNSKQNNRYSSYRGVTFHKKEKNPWQARIGISGAVFHLGYFPSEVEAALAYNSAAKQHYGEFARLNQIKEQTE